MSRDHLIEVRPNVFLNPADPEFHRKYLTYYPNDRESLYQYGLICLDNGEWEKGKKFVEKAASFSHPEAVKEIRNWHMASELPAASVPATASASNKALTSTALLWALAFVLFLIVLFLVFVIASHLKQNGVTTQTVENRTMYGRHLFEEQTGVEKRLPENKKTNLSTLPVLVVQSAVEYHQKENGTFPVNEKALVGAFPDNILSHMPEGVSYEATFNGYAIVNEAQSDKLYENGLLSLHFYPKTNELALQRGNEVLALYPVASGKEVVPNPSDKVTLRVAEPMGKNGAFGSKGLALSDNFAIHGTNAPESIGQKVTEGCLRMTNEHIDNLYPYVALGTPFTVEPQEASPSTPTFAEGLPELAEKVGSKAVETSVLSYNWKG